MHAFRVAQFGNDFSVPGFFRPFRSLFLRAGLLLGLLSGRDGSLGRDRRHLDFLATLDLLGDLFEGLHPGFGLNLVLFDLLA